MSNRYSVESPLSRYLETAQGIANAWGGNMISRQPGSPAAFDEAANVLHEATVQRGALDALNSGKVLKGSLVIFRFLVHASHAAREQGVSLDELSAALSDPRSYTYNLGMIAARQIEIAKKAEAFAGVGTALAAEDPEARARYVFTRGAQMPSYVAIAGLGARIIHEERFPSNDYEPRPEAQCPMHRAGHTLGMYTLGTEIALRDPALIPAVMDESDSTTPTSHDTSVTIVRA